MTGVHYKRWQDAPTGEAWRWPHFTARELACKCGRWCEGSYVHQPAFLDNLEVLRQAIGRALKINSGHRCPLHNANVGGAPLSQHKAIAADISLRGHDPVQLARYAAGVGFTGLGFGRTFLHVDMRFARAAFHYPGGKAAWTARFGFDPAVRFKLTGHLEA
ncbi:D-Ala-D-Ala carboxypeptidase family metallohydrolase [Phenylobacterium sp.]|uniref:D-Ala-D-Ala carboxypeptidase family metallohydrolase n=1 Tax=Phenylobacterium sp. TaxID=1871053 RepID=UPI002FCC73A0